VFDTVGLKEPQLGTKEYLEAIVNAYELIKMLKQEGGIHLLLFCVRAAKFTSSIQNNYLLFYEWFCEKKVPIVLVLTGLEGEGNMEGWWTRSKGPFEKHNIIVNSHVCITAATRLDGKQLGLYQLSRTLVHACVREYIRDWKEEGALEEPKEIGGWFRAFKQKLKKLFKGTQAAEKEIVTALMEHCGMPRGAAKQLVRRGCGRK
jgi:hypothetical protein